MIDSVLENIASNFFNWGGIAIVIVGGYFFLKKCADSGFSMGAMIAGLAGILAGGLAFSQLPSMINMVQDDGENITGLRGGYNLMSSALDMLVNQATITAANIADTARSIR